MTPTQQPLWIDDAAALESAARRMDAAPWLGFDTEFMRERTYFPRLCLLQISTPEAVFCIDTLGVALDALAAAFQDTAKPKLAHAARQDFEALQSTACRETFGLFDTQIAGACAGFKMQSGYAELVKELLGVELAKGHTRTDWARRPLSREQLAYAADDVRYLGAIADALRERLRQLGREHWVREECAKLEDLALYTPDPASAWMRVKALVGLGERGQRVGRALAAWREEMAVKRNLPRAWVLSDRAIALLAQHRPTSLEHVSKLLDQPTRLAPAILDIVRTHDDGGSDDARGEPDERAIRPDPEQKIRLDALAHAVDERAAELCVPSELLATRADLKRWVQGDAPQRLLQGWRYEEIGARLAVMLHEI